MRSCDWTSSSLLLTPPYPHSKCVQQHWKNGLDRGDGILRSNVRYHDRLLERQQQHERLNQMSWSKGFTVHVLPLLLSNAGEVVKSTLMNVKLAGADANRISESASLLSIHSDPQS